MSLSFLLIRKVNARVNVFDMKLNFSEPKIYTGGVQISEWSKLTKNEKEAALKKKWFIYYSYRDPQTQKLKRQPHIKGGVNKFKTKRERIAFLRTMQKALLELLQAGFNPYVDNSELEGELFGNKESNTNIKRTIAVSEKAQELTQEKTQKAQVNSGNTDETQEISLIKAFKLGLRLKEKLMNQSSFTKYKSRIKRFDKWLNTKGYGEDSINAIDKK